MSSLSARDVGPSYVIISATCLIFRSKVLLETNVKKKGKIIPVLN
jgi:hypothetical protein